MFQVKCIIDDKYLPSVLRALGKLPFVKPVVTPLAAEMSDYQRAKPMKKTKRRKPVVLGSRERKGKGAREFVEATVAEAIAISKNYISVKDVRKLAESKGYEKTSYYYGIKQLVAEGKLKPLPTMGDYEIVRETAAA